MSEQQRGTEYRYMPEYQDGTYVRGDAEQGGTWWIAGDIGGYVTLDEAHAALAGEEFKHAQQLGRLTNTRIWRVTATQELV